MKSISNNSHNCNVLSCLTGKTPLGSGPGLVSRTLHTPVRSLGLARRPLARASSPLSSGSGLAASVPLAPLQRWGALPLTPGELRAVEQRCQHGDDDEGGQWTVSDSGEGSALIAWVSFGSWPSAPPETGTVEEGIRGVGVKQALASLHTRHRSRSKRFCM